MSSFGGSRRGRAKFRARFRGGLGAALLLLFASGGCRQSPCAPKPYLATYDPTSVILNFERAYQNHDTTEIGELLSGDFQQETLRVCKSGCQRYLTREGEVLSADSLFETFPRIAASVRILNLNILPFKFHADSAFALVMLQLRPNRPGSSPDCQEGYCGFYLHLDPPLNGSWKIARLEGSQPFKIVGGMPCGTGYVYRDDEPLLVKAVAPIYPEEARRKGIQGKVILNALVLVDGTVGTVEVQQGIPELNQAAIDAVKQYLFKPAAAYGIPVAVWVAIPVTFKLSGNESSWIGA